MSFGFVVRKDFPAKTLREYVSYAKANPGKISNATNGQGVFSNPGMSLKRA